jgi:hypothetical protein
LGEKSPNLVTLRPPWCTFILNIFVQFSLKIFEIQTTAHKGRRINPNQNNENATSCRQVALRT